MANTTTSQTPAQARFAAARAAAADLGAHKAGKPVNAEQDAPRVLVVGEQFHALVDGLTIGRSAEPWSTLPAIVTRKGETYTADAEMIAAAVNRHGNPGWAGVVHDEAAQRRRWGRVYLAPGPAPEDLPTWEPGTSEWAEARAAAHAAAVAETDADTRAAKLAEVRRIFGNPPQQGQSVQYNVDREHDSQRDRIEGRATPRIRG